MKRNVFVLIVASVFAWQPMSFADSSVDALIQKLKDKGILTNEEASQLKEETAKSQENSQKAVVKSMLPDWVNGIKISGDMRLRYQSQERSVRNFSGSSAQVNPHDRGRVRARLNFEDQINDRVKFVFGLGTDGTGGNNGSGVSVYNFNRSNNYSFGGNGSSNTNQASGSFAKDFLVLNKAYAEYTPNQNWKLDIGKMDNPIWEPSSISTERLLWDPNITPEGGAIRYQNRLNDFFTPYTTDAVFVMKDQGHSTTDAWMYVNQAGVKGNLTDKIYYNLAGTWYGINNPQKIPMDQRSNDLTNTTLVGNCPKGDGAAINGVTNCYAYSYNAIVGAIDLGMNDPFGEMLPVYIPQIGVRAEVIRNPETRIPSNQKNGWEFGAYMGNSSLNGWGTWQISSDYRVLERDAWMDIFPDFDQYTGDTNIQGIRSELDIGLMKNMWFSFNIFDYHVYKPFVNPALAEYSGGNSQITNAKAREVLYQADINMKF